MAERTTPRPAPRRATPPDAATIVAGERRRIFEDAQRQADSVFAQYQLSQLVALGGDLGVMAASVIGELVRVSDAVAGALWLSSPRDRVLRLCATEPDAGSYPDAAPRARGRSRPWPTRTPGSARAAGTASRSTSGARSATTSPGSRTVGFIALRPPEGASLPPDRIRLLALVRHELAIAFRAAQLRDALAGEQALLAAILDGANDGIVAVDDARRVVRVNRAASVAARRSATPRPPATCRELLGCDVGSDGEPAPPGSAAGRAAGSRRCSRARRASSTRRCASRRPDGTEVPVAASFCAMAGREPGAVVVLRDLRADLAAEELRASFLAAVSHELRTPLALIGGYVDSLLDLELDPAAQRRSVERIGHAATRLNLLVDELLELTQLEHASLGLRRTRVDVAALLADFTRDLGESPGMPQVHVAAPQDLPPVDADAVRIGHVLANLVDNARKYGGDGPVDDQRAARAAASSS